MTGSGTFRAELDSDGSKRQRTSSGPSRRATTQDRESLIELVPNSCGGAFKRAAESFIISS